MTLLLGGLGALGTVALARAARRASAGARVRALSDRPSWRLVSPIREPLVRWLAGAQVGLEPEAAIELWAGLVAAAAMVTAALSPGLLVVVVPAALAAGPVTLDVARRRGRHRYEVALPAVLERVAAGLRGGAGLSETLVDLASADGPLRDDLRRVTARAALGLGLADSLARWPDERRITGVRASVGALALAAQMGGRSADALEGLATSLRARLAAFAETRALSSQARASALVVGLAPIAYLVVATVLDPGSVSVLVTTGAGRLCLLAGLGLEMVAAWWMRRIVGSVEPA